MKMERGDAWKELALGSRQIVDGAFLLLADASALLDHIGTDKCLDLSKRIVEFVENTNVPIPGSIMPELIAFERNN